MKKEVKDMDNKEKAKVFKAFCDESRLKILDILKHGELCACDILDKMEIGQSTLSHHMKILCDAGIVTGRKQGKWMHYSIEKQGLVTARQILSSYDISDSENINKSRCCE